MQYFATIYHTLISLLKGMKTTGGYFGKPGNILTEQYPDNRDTLIMPERFRGEVVMPHTDDNIHRCTGCTACEIACPNGTIKVVTKMELNEEGKKKKRLDQFVYRLSMCTFCNLCILSCPTDAIKMSTDFEHSVYDRNDLIKILNQEGSDLEEELK